LAHVLLTTIFPFRTDLYACLTYFGYGVYCVNSIFPSCQPIGWWVRLRHDDVMRFEEFNIIIHTHTQVHIVPIGEIWQNIYCLGQESGINMNNTVDREMNVEDLNNLSSFMLNQ
jgi:hypothetical protein